MSDNDYQEISSPEEKQRLIDKAYSMIFDKITHKEIFDKKFLFVDDKNSIMNYINDKNYFLIENNRGWKGKKYHVHGLIIKCSAQHIRDFIESIAVDGLCKNYIILPIDDKKPVITITEDDTFMVFNT